MKTSHNRAFLASLAIGLASFVAAQSPAATITTTSSSNLEIYWNDTVLAANGDVLLRRYNSAEQSAIVAFNLGSLGWNNAWTVDSATLTLTVKSDGLTAGNRTLVLDAKGVAPSNSAWVAGTSTWSYQVPSTTQWTNASGTSVNNFSLAAGTWAALGTSTTSSPSAPRAGNSTLTVSLNATMVQSWLNNPAIYNGMSLQANNSSDSGNIAFYGTGEASNLRPELSITYTIPEPTTALMVALSGLAFICLRKRSRTQSEKSTYTA